MREVWGSVKGWGLEDYSDHSPAISIDPVCGRQVDEATAAGKASYAGVLYYFCSKECHAHFEQTPGTYFGRPHAPSLSRVDINTSNADDLKAVLQLNDDAINRILQNRPYQNWDNFKDKNPGFSDPVLKSLRQLGLILSTPDLNRMGP